MSKFTVIEYMNPAGDVDTIEVDLTWSSADIVALLSYQIKKHEGGWVRDFGPTSYFDKRYTKLCAIALDAKRRFTEGKPVDELTFIDWQE